MAPNGEFVVAWQSYASSGTDSSESSIQGQRFGRLAAAVSLLSPAPRIALVAALLSLGTFYALRRLC